MKEILICFYFFSLEIETNAFSSRMISVCDCSVMVICFSFFFPQIETNSFSLRMTFVYDCSMVVILICFSFFFLGSKASSSSSMMIFVCDILMEGTWCFLSSLYLGCFSVLLDRLSRCLNVPVFSPLVCHSVLLLEISWQSTDCCQILSLSKNPNLPQDWHLRISWICHLVLRLLVPRTELKGTRSSR